MSTFALMGCRKNPTGNKDGNTGVYIDRIAFVSNYGVSTPLITVADVYKTNSSYLLQNKKILTEGILPRMSVDRKWIAFILLRDRPYVMRINIDSTALEKISFPTDLAPQDVDMSADGKTLAVDCIVGNSVYAGMQLVLVPSLGGTPQAIYSDSGRVAGASWSPDNKIYFEWVDQYNKYGLNDSTHFFLKGYIKCISNDGSYEKSISDTITGISDDAFPDISPDGKEIAFASYRNHGDQPYTEIFSMDNNGRTTRQLTYADIGPIVDSLQHREHYTIDNTPRWVGNGKYIVFQRETFVWDATSGQYRLPWTTDLYIIDPNTLVMQNLTSDGTSGLMKH
jgi:Tol biopolymer transport system component